MRPGTSGIYAAQLSSKLAGLVGVYKLAAGNLFTGIFYGIRNLTHGIVCFGQPFEARPTALHGWFKYNQGMLTNVGSTQPPGMNLKVGDPDNGMIYIAVGTWTPEEYGISQENSSDRPKTRLRSTPATPVRSSIRRVRP